MQRGGALREIGEQTDGGFIEKDENAQILRMLVSEFEDGDDLLLESARSEEHGHDKSMKKPNFSTIIEALAESQEGRLNATRMTAQRIGHKIYINRQSGAQALLLIII